MPTLKPLELRSTMKPVNALLDGVCGLELVFAKIKYQSAIPQFVIHAFDPFKIKYSPLISAFVFKFAKSEPALVSVTA